MPIYKNNNPFCNNLIKSFPLRHNCKLYKIKTQKLSSKKDTTSSNKVLNFIYVQDVRRRQLIEEQRKVDQNLLDLQ